MVNEGDTIQPNQPVVEIETDKAVLEVPCPLGGRVTKVHVKQGQKAKVGSPLISVETNGAATAPAPQKKEPPAADKSKQAAKVEAPRDSGAIPADKSRADTRRESAEQKAAANTPPVPAVRKPPAAGS